MAVPVLKAAASISFPSALVQKAAWNMALPCHPRGRIGTRA